MCIFPIQNSPETLFSNFVLETEHGRISAELQQASSLQKQDLVFLKESYELRMNFLVLIVQTGKLSVEEYISQLESGVDVHRKRALMFKKRGRIEEAKQCLARCKLMEAELKEMKE